MSTVINDVENAPVAPPGDYLYAAEGTAFNNVLPDVMTCAGTGGDTVYIVKDHVENEQMRVTVLWAPLTGDIRISVENRLTGSRHGTMIDVDSPNNDWTDYLQDAAATSGACGVYEGSSKNGFTVTVMVSAIDVTATYKGTVTVSYTLTFHGDWTIGTTGGSTTVGASASGTVAVSAEYSITYHSTSNGFQQGYGSGVTPSLSVLGIRPIAVS